MKQRQVIPISPEAIPVFQASLLAWFEQQQRDLPWRKSYIPYEVWIAEIMGQQTQMDRVVAYFQQWLAQFPDVRAVAEASQQSLIKAWEGLGYYSRVRNIQRTAQVLVGEYGGHLPREYQQLLDLPGIGPYTAAAILSIAYNEPYPLLDANVERVFARVADIDRPLAEAGTKRFLRQMAEAVLARDRPRVFNQALMELGALVCTPKNPDCRSCPIREHCTALSAGTVDQRPVAKARQQRIDIVMACGIIRSQGEVYIQQRLEEDVWGGLWEFPGGQLKNGESAEAAMIREIKEETAFQVRQVRSFKTVTHYYTRYRVTLHGFYCQLASPQTVPTLQAASQFRWLPVQDLDAYAFPSGHRQLVQVLMKQE